MEWIHAGGQLVRDWTCQTSISLEICRDPLMPSSSRVKEEGRFEVGFRGALRNPRGRKRENWMEKEKRLRAEGNICRNRECEPQPSQRGQQSRTLKEWLEPLS
eukprot:365231-Chlamydomonas_euryale.AAC.6